MPSLKLVISEKRVFDQVSISGLADELGAGNVYRSTEWIGETVRRAYADALRGAAARLTLTLRAQRTRLPRRAASLLNLSPARLNFPASRNQTSGDR